MSSFTINLLGQVAARFAQHPDIEAVVLAGSVAVGIADERSDFDVYVYSRNAVPVEFREELLKSLGTRREVHRTFWEEEDAWIQHDGTKFEAMYRSCDWAENEINARLERFEASIGYTTAFLFNILRSQPLFDRTGWFATLQNRLVEPYAHALATAIIAKNLPLLGDIIGSYEDQIRSAFVRRDLISLNHRVAAWLASYFDVLFAGNRRFHPGEKRLLAHATALPDRPDGMADDLSLACLSAADLQSNVAYHLAKMRVRLGEWLQRRTP